MWRPLVVMWHHIEYSGILVDLPFMLHRIIISLMEVQVVTHLMILVGKIFKVSSDLFSQAKVIYKRNNLIVFGLFYFCWFACVLNALPTSPTSRHYRHYK